MRQITEALLRPFSSRRGILLVVVVTAIALAACRGGGSNPSENDQQLPVIVVTISPNECVNSFQPEGAPQFAGIDTTRLEIQEDALRFYDIEVGTGDSPTVFDAVTVEYTGWLDDGCMFDTSYPDDGPITFPLIGVIEGWQQGFTTMKVGGTRVLEIGPDLGYRAAGFPPRIPPNATLYFHVTLLDYITVAQAQATIEARIATATAEAGSGGGTPTP